MTGQTEHSLCSSGLLVVSRALLIVHYKIKLSVTRIYSAFSPKGMCLKLSVLFRSSAVELPRCSEQWSSLCPALMMGQVATEGSVCQVSVWGVCLGSEATVFYLTGLKVSMTCTAQETRLRTIGATKNWFITSGKLSGVTRYLKMTPIFSSSLLLQHSLLHLFGKTWRCLNKSLTVFQCVLFPFCWSKLFSCFSFLHSSAWTNTVSSNKPDTAHFNCPFISFSLTSPQKYSQTSSGPIYLSFFFSVEDFYFFGSSTRRTTYSTFGEIVFPVLYHAYMQLLPPYSTLTLL